MKNKGRHKPAGKEPSLEHLTPEEKVYMVLATVPAGTVVSYGQVAELAGLPGAARMVGRILGKLPKETQLPWHRVINAAGRISLAVDSPGFKVQKARLQEEGVVLNDNRVSLKKFNWQP
jgi:methylated-DNA-protein-cysteine methyltransferase-like protein